MLALILVAACSREDQRIDPSVLAPRLLQDEAEIATYVATFPAGAYRIYNVPAVGSFYVDDPQDLIKQWLVQGMVWEPHILELLRRHARPGSVVVDVGAHIGVHTLSLATLVGAQGIVYAFEPQRKIYRELVHNLRLNGAANVVPLRFALGAQSAIEEMNPATARSEGSTGVGAGGDRVEMRTLDSFGLRNLSLLKIDVEGFEDNVLDGARETIARNRPVIVIEIQGDFAYVTAPPPIRQRIERTMRKLEDLGYSLQLIKGADYLALPTR